MQKVRFIHAYNGYNCGHIFETSNKQAYEYVQMRVAEFVYDTEVIPESNPTPPLTDLTIEFVEWTCKKECPYHPESIQGDFIWLGKHPGDSLDTQQLFDFWLKEVKGK